MPSSPPRPKPNSSVPSSPVDTKVFPRSTPSTSADNDSIKKENINGGGSATLSSDQPEQVKEESDSSPVGIIDMDTFRQILDLDEDETHDFSSGMAYAYFDQAATTFTEMETALAAKDLAKLSSLGHFLKGSSAALGVAKVQASCERMQHYGQRRDEGANIDLTAEEALEKIDRLLVQVKKEYSDAEEWLRSWYKEHGVEPEV